VIDKRTFARLPDFFGVARVPRWLTALTMVSASDAVATCPRRLAERMAGVLGLQMIETDFAGPRFAVSAVRRIGHADAGIDWLLAAVRDGVI
jgi:DNA-binding transcriptional LysR family regulator